MGVDLSRRKMLALAAGSVVVAAIPQAALAEKTAERTWLSSHWLCTSLDNSVQVIMVFQGQRSDGRIFTAVRSLQQTSNFAMYAARYDVLSKEWREHVDGFLRADCECYSSCPDSPGMLVSEAGCRFHEKFYTKGNMLKSSYETYRRLNGSRAPEPKRLT